VTYPGSGQVSETAMYAGDEYVLKVCRDDQACRLSIGMTEALHQQGIPASLAVPLPDGRMTLPLSDGLQMILCRRLHGKAVLPADVIRNPEDGSRIGAALAKMHLAAASLGDLPYAEDEPWADHITHWAMPQVKGVLDEDFLTDFAARVEALADLPVALIHRDPNPGNLIDTAEGIGFVDFELSRRFLRIFDPCYTATAVLSEVFERDDLPWQENWPVFIRALLAGYDSVSLLTDAEWSAVPTLMIGNEVLSIAAFAGSSKYKHIFDVNMRMLPWMMANMPV
jgi:Ser/Thr protein kinase RdoA (MazF antagonist)